MGKEFRRHKLDSEVVDRISERLSKVGELHLPHSITSHQQISSPQIKSFLCDLLSRDAALFLERYGSKLKSEELEEFEILKHDYEINWHMKQLKMMLNPTLEEKRLQAVKAKNRRLAYMDRLVHDGQYFSEDAMREREPLLHHEYVGRFQDPCNRGFSRPGERWSETLMRQSEEASIVQRIREEQQRLGIREETIEEEEEEEEEEEDSEEEEEKETEEKSEVANQEERSDKETSENTNISSEELQERMDTFTRVMKEKFLSGEDAEHVDYACIDSNVALDDYWLKEITQDAEEKYFEADD